MLDLWGVDAGTGSWGRTFFDLKYPDDLAAKLQRQIQEVIQTKERLVDETPYTGLTGAGGYYQYIFSPVIGANGLVEAVAGSTRDISDLKRAEAALRASEARFRQIADAMPQIAWAARPDGVLDYYNRRWFEYINLPPEMHDEARWDRYVHPDDLAKASEAWSAALQSGNPYQIEFRVRGAEGVHRWFLVRATPGVR